MGRVTVRDIGDMKVRSEKIPTITAYDFPTARLAEAAGIPLVLVGDSLGMVMLGYGSTIPVTIEDMIHHVKAVIRGTSKALIVADMPFMSYQINTAQALSNAAQLIQQGGAQAIKLEGGENVANTVRNIVECGIPVMGHIGMTPQSIHTLGGYRVKGRNHWEALQLLKDAKALEAAGAFSVVLELVPAPLAKLVSQSLTIPTIGIGAGPDCDGQVQVLHDMLGLFTDFVPKHTKQYARLADSIQDAIARYIQEVKEGSFPTEKESFSMDETILENLSLP
jgi:3-methyl-2-oxobutanoate hydroxymethyltransferase